MNELNFTISAKDQASAAVDTVNKKIQSLGKDIAKNALTIASPIALVSAGFDYVANKVAEYNKKVEEAAEKTAGIGAAARDAGLGVEEYQKLANAADASGVKLENLTTLFKELNDIISKAKSGDANAVNLVEKLGLTQDLHNNVLTSIKLFERMGQAVAGAKDQTEAEAMAVAMLGKTLATQLLPSLREAQRIKDAYGEDSGLTADEIKIMEEAKVLEKKKANKEGLVIAKKVVAEAKGNRNKEFVESGSPEAQALIKDYAAKKGLSESDAKNALITGATAGATYAGSAEATAAIDAAIKKRDEAKKAQQAAEGAAAAEGARQLIAQQRAAEEARAIEGLAKQRDEAKRQAENGDLTDAQKLAAIQTDIEKKKAEMAAITNKNSKEYLQSEIDLYKLMDDKRKLGEKINKDNSAARDKENKELDDALAAQEKADKEKKSTKLTVSSLRMVGGAMLGEQLSPSIINDIPKQQLTVQQQILLEMQKLNGNAFKPDPSKLGETDFTKNPMYENVA
jgi:hypothetical protein